MATLSREDHREMNASRAIVVRTWIAFAAIAGYGCGGETSGDEGGDATIDTPVDQGADDTPVLPDTRPDADASADADAEGGACSKPKTSCGGDCVDTKSDPSNCGGCGKRCCAGQLCAGGACTTGCPPPRIVCVDPSVGCPMCADPTVDPKNCGGCGNVCPSGVCIDGSCATPDAASDGETD
jgi:hypothetical protein